MSDNWVVQNLENALETWNEKLSEIWTLITTTPQNFKGGNIWKVIVDINGAVQAIGLALLVLFFVIGMVKTCGSFTDVKKPEHALKLFVRFALAKGVITYGMELMLALFNIVQGMISTIMNAAGFGTPEQTTLPAEMVTTIEDCGFFESIPLWAVTLIGGLFITVLSFILIMTVYGRFFKSAVGIRSLAVNFDYVLARGTGFILDRYLYGCSLCGSIPYNAVKRLAERGVREAVTEGEYNFFVVIPVVLGGPYTCLGGCVALAENGVLIPGFVVLSTYARFTSRERFTSAKLFSMNEDLTSASEPRILSSSSTVWLYR